MPFAQNQTKCPRAARSQRPINSELLSAQLQRVNEEVDPLSPKSGYIGVILGLYLGYFGVNFASRNL